MKDQIVLDVKLKVRWWLKPAVLVAAVILSPLALLARSTHRTAATRIVQFLVKHGVSANVR